RRPAAHACIGAPDARARGCNGSRFPPFTDACPGADRTAADCGRPRSGRPLPAHAYGTLHMKISCTRRPLSAALLLVLGLATGTAMAGETCELGSGGAGGATAAADPEAFACGQG